MGRLWSEPIIREKVEAAGGRFISEWDALCNDDGCLTRTGDGAKDIVAIDRVHLTTNGSIYLLNAIVDDLL